MYIDHCQLTGTISPSISNLKNLTVVFLNNNNFKGFIPDTLHQIERLLKFDISTNYLTGSINDNIVNLKFLETLDLSSNNLISTIPEDIGNLTNLADLVLSYNRLTSTIPTSIRKLKYLRYLIINNNYISSTIPNVLYQNELLGLFLSENLFLGTISSEIGVMSTLKYMFIQGNLFSKSLPSELGMLVNIEQLSFGNNLFTGTVPLEISNMRSLVTLNLSQNLFVGDMNKIWEKASFGMNLATVDLSFNAFSGHLSNDLFKFNPQLTTVNLISNCFKGNIPSYICDCKHLSVLVLDLASSGHKCLVNNNNFFLKALDVLYPIINYPAQNELENGIPSCIWNMKSLVTFHAAGNGLTGTLSDFSTNTSLQDINIANNYLVGTLPYSWQKYGELQQLDIKNNRLTGTLESDFVTGQLSIIEFSNNRFSGELPPNLLLKIQNYDNGDLDKDEDKHEDTGDSISIFGSNIDILTGNLFECTQSSIPDNINYVCGSNNLEQAMSLWVVSTMFLLIICSLMYFGVQNISSYRFKNRNEDESNVTFDVEIKDIELHSGMFSKIIGHLINFYDRTKLFMNSSFLVEEKLNNNLYYRHVFLNTLSISKLCAIRILLYYLLACSCYVIMKLSSDFSTHNYQYLWYFTTAYLQGFIPALLVQIFAIVSVVDVSYTFLRKGNTIDNSNIIKRNFLSESDDPIDYSSHRVSFLKPRSITKITKTNAKNNEIKKKRNKNLFYNDFVAKDDTLTLSNRSGDTNVSSNIQIKSFSSVLILITYTLGPIILMLIVQIINIVATSTANASYIYILNSPKSKFVSLSIVQLLLGAYKQIWNRLYVYWIVRKIFEFYPSSLTEEKLYLSQLFMSIFNLVAGPILVTMFTDSNCFLYMFDHEQPNFLAFFEYTEYCKFGKKEVQQGLIFLMKCNLIPVQFKATFTPPFSYSNQCSSDLLINYIPVFLYSYLIMMIGTIFKYLYLLTSHLWLFKFQLFLEKYFKIQFNRNFGENVYFSNKPNKSNHDNINPLHGINDYDTRNTSIASRESTLVSTSRLSVLLDLNMIISEVDGAITMRKSIVYDTITFLGAKMTIRLMMNFVVLLCFGLASPLLAIVIVSNILLDCTMWKLETGRFIELLKNECFQDPNPNLYEEGFKLLDDACNYALSGLHSKKGGFMLMCTISLFWGLMIFDMISDDYGVEYGRNMVIFCIFFLPFFSLLILYFSQDIINFDGTELYISNIYAKMNNQEWKDFFFGVIYSEINDENNDNSSFVHGQVDIINSRVTEAGIELEIKKNNQN